MMEDMPREDHYALGHEVLRYAAEENPELFFMAMGREDVASFLQRIIDRVEDVCGECSFSPEDLNVSNITLDDIPCLIIQLPPVKAYAECIYVGVVLLKNDSDDWVDSSSMRYFTLEMGEGDDGDVVFFCEWLEGAHCNISEESLSTSKEEFAELISNRLAA